MFDLEKLHHYRERLTKWHGDLKKGLPVGPEPKPEDFGITDAGAKFVARQMREKVVGK